MIVHRGKDRRRKSAFTASPVLADIVRRIVEVARPERIVLFGSAARGRAGPNSDLDLLVVKSGRFHRGRLLESIYRALRGAGAPVDVVVVTPEELQRYRDVPCLIVAPALREGKLVYGHVQESDRLTRFAVEARYPGLSGPVSKPEHRRAVRIAKNVLRWATRQVGKCCQDSAGDV